MIVLPSIIPWHVEERGEVRVGVSCSEAASEDQRYTQIPKPKMPQTCLEVLNTPFILQQEVKGKNKKIVHFVKDYRQRRGTTPFNLSLDTRWRLVVNYKVDYFILEKEPFYPTLRLGGPQGLSGRVFDFL
jgi:hypothetical protein